MPLSKKRNRERMRLSRLHKLISSPQYTMRLRERKIKPIRSCEVCPYTDTVDIHHEGDAREEHTLCPNHHALITRHIKTLEQLLSSQTSKPVQPKMYMAGVEIALPELDADGDVIPEVT